jgi:hypothetical protein
VASHADELRPLACPARRRPNQDRALRAGVIRRLDGISR